MTLDQKAEAVLSLSTKVQTVGWDRRVKTYAVPSRSEPGELRIVTLWRNGAARCTCPCGEFRRHGCIHVAAVLYLRAHQAEARERAMVRGRCQRRSFVRAA